MYCLGQFLTLIYNLKILTRGMNHSICVPDLSPTDVGGEFMSEVKLI